MTVTTNNIQRRNEMSLIELFFNGKRTSEKRAVNTDRDTVTISSEAKSMKKVQHAGTTSSNTRIDQSIDLQAYFNNAREANQKAIAEAGNEIGGKPKAYTNDFDVYKAALKDKYSKLLTEAKSHSNPEQYIQQKYYNSSSTYYAADLSAEERGIAYRNEMRMLKDGEISSMVGDSLFRGININADSFTVCKIEFERQMVNSQIGNILQKAGVELDKDQELSFSVTPFSYYISIEGADDALKSKIESALNVGSNGENLYRHINKSAIHGEGVKSTQITVDGTIKNRLFSAASAIVGLDIRELTERDGSYYTDNGEDIRNLFMKSIDEMDKPSEINCAMKEYYLELVRQVATKGWNNIADMVLSINYNQSGLRDKYQNYGYGK